MTTIILLSLLAVLGVANLAVTLSRKAAGGREMSDKLARLDTDLLRVDGLIREELGRGRSENQAALKSNREELNNAFKLLGDNLTKTIAELSNAQKNQFDLFAQNVKEFNTVQKQKFDDLANRQDSIKKSTEDKLKEIRETVEGKLTRIQDDNNSKLEEMRKTVDEKLQESINRRFNESFELISKRLEEVQKGLGEMQTLASDVGGLKKVLTNVKTRGTFGEVQLESLLAQVLSPEQYAAQVATKKDSLERVDAVVRLPGQADCNSALLLPIDSKFPAESYQRLCDAYEAGEAKETLSDYRKKFEEAVRVTAKSIAAKYINPPETTDFAIMFVPSEGIYAEILRNAELFESLRRDYRITIVGPTNLAAFLSSLQMGFRTLAVQKRTSEVWALLGSVKTEFGKFGDVLDNASKQLQTVANSITKAGVRTRAIERKLRDVESQPQDEPTAILDDPAEAEQDTLLLENNTP